MIETQEFYVYHLKEPLFHSGNIHEVSHYNVMKQLNYFAAMLGDFDRCGISENRTLLVVRKEGKVYHLVSPNYLFSTEPLLWLEEALIGRPGGGANE